MFLDTSSEHESSPWHSCTSVVFRSCSEVTFQSDKFLWMIFNLAALLTPICSTQTLAEKDPSDARPRQTISERVCLCAPSVLVCFFFFFFLCICVNDCLCCVGVCVGSEGEAASSPQKTCSWNREHGAHDQPRGSVCVCVCVSVCACACVCGHSWGVLHQLVQDFSICSLKKRKASTEEKIHISVFLWKSDIGE